MDQVWFKLFAIMIGGNIVKYLFANPLIWVILDLAVFAACYLYVRQYAYIDLKKTLILLGGLTVVNILVDTAMISALIGNVVVLGMAVWVIWQGGLRGSSGAGRKPLRHKWHK